MVGCWPTLSLVVLSGKGRSLSACVRSIYFMLYPTAGRIPDTFPDGTPYGTPDGTPYGTPYEASCSERIVEAAAHGWFVG